MADPPDQTAESLLNRAWDTLGQYMGAAGEMGETMSRRNLDLWTRVSATLRTSDDRLEALKEDAVQVVQAAIDNTRDVRRVLMTSPDRRSVARPLPAAFLRFDPNPARPGTFAPPDGVWIDAPAGAGAADVQIMSGPGGGLQPLQDCLTVGAPERRGYYLGTRNVGALKPGSYAGVVCDAATRRPLADLRIEVAGP